MVERRVVSCERWRFRVPLHGGLRNATEYVRSSEDYWVRRDERRVRRVLGERANRLVVGGFKLGGKHGRRREETKLSGKETFVSNRRPLFELPGLDINVQIPGIPFKNSLLARAVSRLAGSCESCNHPAH